MILFLVVNEACRVYAQGIVVKTANLDIAGVMASGGATLCPPGF